MYSSLLAIISDSINVWLNNWLYGESTNKRLIMNNQDPYDHEMLTNFIICGTVENSILNLTRKS